MDINTRGELNDAEGLNIVNAHEWLGSGRIEDVFTVRFYRELHTKMFDQVWGWAGALRTDTGDQVGEPFVRAEQVAAELGKVAMMFSREWEELNSNELVRHPAREPRSMSRCTAITSMISHADDSLKGDVPLTKRSSCRLDIRRQFPLVSR